VLDALRRWRRRRLLDRLALPEDLWREALATLPFLSDWRPEELARLRELAALFLHAKSIVGAREFEVTPRMRVVIATQACVPILGLDLDWYRGWENVIVYPDEFYPKHRYEDEAGVVHETDEPFLGEAMHHGPVLLSWPDVEASAEWHATGMNLVLHEFAHKLDMLDGEADGVPPLHAGMSRARWAKVLGAAYEDFCKRVDRGEETWIDPYAAEHESEFFAVTSEVFFAEPETLTSEYPELYAELVAFYRQDPASRAARDDRDGNEDSDADRR
jgi:Mlc titration factor MtfA (ptsG expression regulator)